MGAEPRQLSLSRRVWAKEGVRMNQLALSLTLEHAARLLDYMHQYRGVLLTQLSPSTERNQRQRLVQGVQGRLPQECERGGAFATLPLNQEELAARVATPPCSIWLSSSSC